MTIPDGVLSRFAYQLASVRLQEVHLQPRNLDPDAGAEELPFKIELREKEEDRGKITETFSALLVLETSFPVHKWQIMDIYIAIEGHFKAAVSIDDLKLEIVEQFKGADVMLMLWPYLRQTLQDFSSRLGLKIPPLPIIDARDLKFTEPAELVHE
ncbi:MAG: hypothetical protein JXA21_11345 [Anaerolineae bacterium]|nr:hypothetical protein [Anaerolineae bacterium]